VKTMTRWGMGAAGATVALGLFAIGASAQLAPGAQQQAPAAQQPAPAAKAPATAPATQPAAKAPATKAPAAKTEAAKPADPAKKPKAAASACKGLDEGACKGNTDCNWIVPTKVDPKTGKADKAYCRKVAGVAKKAADAKADAAKGATKTPAAKAAAPAAPATQAPPAAPAAKKQ